MKHLTYRSRAAVALGGGLLMVAAAYGVYRAFFGQKNPCQKLGSSRTVEERNRVIAGEADYANLKSDGSHFLMGRDRNGYYSCSIEVKDGSVVAVRYLITMFH